jgi:inosine/xanthosine triphosphatase
MLIGIGTKNKAKLKACRRALYHLNKKYLFMKEPELIALVTKTTVPDMPITKTDLKQGALQRALFVYKTLKHKGKTIDFAVGLEGGIYQDSDPDMNTNDTYLQSWAYVYNGHKGYWGSSPALALPQSVSREVYTRKRELAEVMDHLSGRNDVRSHAGAFGILTEHLITRSDSFYLAIICAMSPFFNRFYQT